MVLQKVPEAKLIITLHEPEKENLVNLAESGKEPQTCLGSLGSNMSQVTGLTA